MGVEFWNTQMGRRFIEGTIPELVRQIKRLADRQQFPHERHKTTLTKPHQNGVETLSLFTSEIESVEDDLAETLDKREQSKATVRTKSGAVHSVLETREEVLKLMGTVEK